MSCGKWGYPQSSFIQMRFSLIKSYKSSFLGNLPCVPRDLRMSGELLALPSETLGCLMDDTWNHSRLHRLSDRDDASSGEENRDQTMTT